MKVLGDRVLVRPTPPPGQWHGLHLPETHYVPEVTGTVVELGDGPRADDGTLLPHRVSIGDAVVFAAESGHDVVVNGNRLIVLREDDLLATLN